MDTTLLFPTSGPHAFPWHEEGLERGHVDIQGKHHLIMLARIWCSAKINYGLSLLRAPSFSSHLCCSEKLIQVIKADQSSAWGPLQQGSVSLPPDTLHWMSPGSSKGSRERVRWDQGWGLPLGRECHFPCGLGFELQPQTPAEPWVCFY